MSLLLLQSGSVGPARGPDVPGVSPAAGVAPASRPALDGRLDDAAWTLATPIAGLMQRDPQEGAAATEQVDVRILYDAEALYIGARLFDSSPQAIIRRLGRRDATTHSDEFRVLLDSYHDRRTAFEFIVNAADVKRDVLLGDDGGYSDESWDAVWEAATAVDSLGWTVEMRIPLSQLRFSGASVQVWGVRFERWIERKNELDMLPLVRKNESGVASRFGDLVGVQNIPAPRHLEVLPYALARSQYDTPDSPGNPFDGGSSYFGGMGADLKYGVSSNLTLDATVNPDFGQVELDPAIVNLTAFEVKLEERRPFFVEGGDIFGFAGAGAGLAKLADRPQYFYSRRIGRPPEGSVPFPRLAPEHVRGGSGPRGVLSGGRHARAAGRPAVIEPLLRAARRRELPLRPAPHVARGRHRGRVSQQDRRPVALERRRRVRLARLRSERPGIPGAG